MPAYRKKSTEVEFVVSEGVAGVPPGSVLVSIDGIQGIEDFEGYDDRAVPVSELRKHYYQWFSRGSSRYALDQGFATWLTARHSKLNPVPTDGDVHTYRFRSGGQKEIELKAKWLDFNPDKIVWLAPDLYALQRGQRISRPRPLQTGVPRAQLLHLSAPQRKRERCDRAHVHV